MINIVIEPTNFPGDWFLLGRAKRSKETLQYYLNQINIDDYNIYKASNKFKLSCKEDLFNMKYARFFLIKKELDINTIEAIDILYNKLKLNGLTYINKPFTSIDILKKIKIIEWQTLNKTTN
jgi:hypothetical protein